MDNGFDIRIPRVVETPRRSMQRLGFLKLLVSISTRQSTETLLCAGQELVRSLTSKVALRWDGRLATYTRSALSEQTHAAARRGAADFLAKDCAEASEIEVEIQDAYLGLGDLPSRRGRLVPTDDSRFPHWGVSLGLNRKEPFGKLVRGNVLLSLVTESELAAFRRFDLSNNPLALTRPQRLFFLYALLEKDLSILVPLHEQLLQRDGYFSDLEAGDLLPELYLSASRSLRNTGREGHDADRALQLAETAEAIKARQGKSYGKTVREQTVTPRLEPLVDIGILTKPDPYTYSYKFTPHGRDFFSNMEGKWPGSSSGFGKAAAAFLGYEDREVSTDSELLYLLHGAWDKLKSHLGYAPITETSLLGLINGLEQGAGWFELAEATASLLRIHKEVPGLLRFNMDRQGKLSVVRFLRAP